MNTTSELVDIWKSLGHLKPELILIGGIVLMIMAVFFKIHSYKKTAIVTIGILLLCITHILMNHEYGVLLFHKLLLKISFSEAIKLLIDTGGIFTCILSLQESRRSEKSAEYFLLILSVILGAHLLVMSADMLMVFISIEMISIPSYVLAGYNFNRQSAEGSIKYFVFGAVSSAVMLYGFSFLYSLSGSTQLFSEGIQQLLADQNNPLVFVAVMMVLAGLLFKIAAVPMHIWAPDIYESAPTPVVAFFSTVPKFAGLGIFIQFTTLLISQNSYWQNVIASLALLTITGGNLGALAQTNPKRMMAYSSIAQSGFMMIPLCIPGIASANALIFYATIYLIANFLVFLYISHFEKMGVTDLKNYSGKGLTHFWPIFFLLIGLVSLTGLPPTAGFTGKLLVFSSLWNSFEWPEHPILIALFSIGLLNTVVSLFYYLRIPYYAFIKQGETGEKQNFLTVQNLFGLILVLVILVMFFVPGLLMGWINNANFVF